MSHPLESLFWPRSVAVFGASPDPHRVRGRLFDNLRGHAFGGRLIPINPSYPELHGFPCYPNLAAAGEPADVALLAIPAAHVTAAAEECAAAGVRHVIIISSGFAEEGGSAIGLQQYLTELARRSGMTITGPNCEGYFNVIGGIAATFSPTAESREHGAKLIEVADRVGVIAQSGGVGFALFARGRAAGLAFSYVVSTGNEAGLSSADFLDYMVQDDRTAAVMLFCEAVRDGPRFVAALAAARRRGKPIIAIKIGGSEAGRRATASHTASLSGWQAAYKAVFARYGVIEANDPDDAVAIAGVLTTCPLPKGRRAAVVTVSGGGGAWMADTLATHGLTLPVLSPALQTRLRSLMPSYGAPQNPIDVTAQGASTGPAMMDAAGLLVSSDEIDMLVLITSLASEQRVSVDPARLRALTKDHGKPITVWTYTPPSPLGRARIAESGLFLHVGLRGCGLALRSLADYAEGLKQPAWIPPVSVPAIDVPYDTAPVLTEHRAKAVLKPVLPAQREELAHTVSEATEAAAAIGFPVALKLQSPDILHKTEAGCVCLGLADRDAVTRAFAQVLQAAETAHPGARIEGVLVQRMAPPGYELVVGVVNDTVFGPIVMVGWGGTAVELMGDVVHRPAPVDENEAAEMIGRLRSARLLHGFRGARPVDVAPLATLVTRLSHAALATRDRIQEIEFNPVILHADGSGLTIADALITLR